MSQPFRALLRPDPWGKTVRGRVYFGALDARRSVARAWKHFALAVYEWIWP